MSEYLTYAAVRTTDIEGVVSQCEALAQKLGIRFEVPMGPSSEAQTWMGVFENGWTFGLSDPAVWELPELFTRLARDQGYDSLSGSTDGDFRKWNYEYAERGEVLHKFSADPSIRHAPAEYASLQGDYVALSRIFNVSRAKLFSQLRQFEAPPIQEFLQVLGFEVRLASRLRFVIVGPGRYVGPSTLSVVVSQRAVETAKAASADGEIIDTAGYTTSAYRVVTKAADAGYATAAGMRAVRFGEESDFNDAHDLFFRLRRDGRARICLEMADKLVQRAADGEFNKLPSPHLEVRVATIHGLRGLALYDLGHLEEAIVEFKERALAINRYVGPQHRASIASLLGEALVKTRRYEEALDPLRLCLAERPLHAATWANLAQAARQSGRLEEARQAVLNGYAADPELVTWTPLRVTLQIGEADLLPERHPEHARTYRHAAQDLMRAGQKLQAVAKFRIAVHHAPTDIDCVWGVACAIAECMREGLIPIDPDDYELIRLLEQVCFGNPSWPWSWGTLIEMLQKMGHRERACQACEAYADLHVTRLEDLQNVSIWLANLDPEIGAYMLKRLIDRFVDLRLVGLSSGADREEARFSALAVLGWTLMQTDRFQEAIQPLTDAAQINPQNCDNLANLAEAHLSLGNALAASKTISRGLRVDPNHARLNALSRQARGA